MSSGIKEDTKIAINNIDSPGNSSVQKQVKTDDKINNGGYCQILNDKSVSGANDVGIPLFLIIKETIVPIEAGSPGGDQAICWAMKPKYISGRKKDAREKSKDLRLTNKIFVRSLAVLVVFDNK